MKYCWDHVDGMMEYRLNLGCSLQPMKWYLLDFSRYLKEKYPEEVFITKEMIIPWCIKRDSEQIVSYRSRISYLRQFTFYLNAIGVCDYIVPVSDLPKAVRYTPYIFTDEELIRLFDYADSFRYITPFSLRNRIVSVIYRLIYFCGLRPNEGRELMVSDLDLENKTLFIRKNKNHKERLIPIADDVCEMMKDYLNDLLKHDLSSQYLFPSPDGTPYKAKWLRCHFKALWEEIKDPLNTSRIRVYDLRHRWASAVMMKFLNQKEDLFAVLPYMSSYMGHSNFEDTAYYIHLIPKNLLQSASIDWNLFSGLLPEADCE